MIVLFLGLERFFTPHTWKGCVIFMSRISISEAAPAGGFFSLSKYGNSEALIFVPRVWKGPVSSRWGERDAIEGDFFVFPDTASMVSGSPEELLNVTCTDTAITRIARDYMGKVIGPFRAEKITTKNGNPAWVLHELPEGNKGVKECTELADTLASAMDTAEDDMPAY